jgi:predicted PurR-regulated permease PerM
LVTAKHIEQTACLRQSRNALVVISILLTVGAIYFARGFLVPIVFAFMIALTFRPVIRKLARRNIPPWASTAGIAGAVSIAVFTASYLFGGPISEWIANAPSIQSEFIEKLRGMRAAFGNFLNLAENIQTAATPAQEPGTQEVVVKGSGFLSMLSSAAGYPANFAIMFGAALVLAVFLMASGDLFYEKLIRTMPTLSDKKTALRIVYDVEHEVSVYLFTITAINFGFALAVGFVFHFLGMPTPQLWAVAAFILNFIPYLGPITGTGLSALVSIVVFDSLGQALLAPMAYALLTGLETQAISPYLLSRRLQLNAVSILLALAFWAWAWGIPGIIIAVPVLVTFRVLCGHINALSGIGEFLAESNGSIGSEAAPAPETASGAKAIAKKMTAA